MLITLLSGELKRALPSCRLAAAGAPDTDTITLSFRHPERPALHLVLALSSPRPFLYLSRRKPASRKNPTNFVSSLRKHLDFARVTAVEQAPGERVVRVRLATGDGAPALLAFEALPKYPNLILADAQGAIVSAHHYKEDVERPVVPGVPYAPPPRPVDKPSIWTIPTGDLRKTWEEAGRPEPALFLKDAFRGTDPEWVRHLAAQEDPFQAAVLTRDRAVAGGWGPVLVRDADPPTLSLFPPPEKGGVPFEDIHAAAEEFHRLERGHREFHAEKRRFESDVRRALKREQRVAVKLKDDRARAEKADQFQWWGELLMAQLHLVPPHARETELEDVVRGTGRRIAVPLDPERPAVANAQRYFQKARKGERGLALVEKREKEVGGRIQALKAALRSVPALARAEEVRQAARDLFPREKPAAPPPRVREERIPVPGVHREKLSRDLELCAGASAAANEHVTFQLAQPDDLWFHAREHPGAHVVLRKLNRNAKFTDEDVMKAARYAASHCKAKTGGKVTVSYTERKYVRRIPGGPAGLVTMTKERSLEVEPERKM